MHAIRRYLDILQESYVTTVSMRLDEISLPFGRGAAIERLPAAGYQQVGDTGSYADVLQKPGRSYVVKIFDADDRAYRAFVALVRQNPNPHFPRFFGKLVELVPDGYYGIRMELLGEMSADDERLDAIADYMWGIGKDRALYPLLQSPVYAQRVALIAADPALQQACDLIVQHRGQFMLDIKIDNLMLRGDTVVFIDPLKIR